MESPMAPNEPIAPIAHRGDRAAVPNEAIRSRDDRMPESRSWLPGGVPNLSAAAPNEAIGGMPRAFYKRSHRGICRIPRWQLEFDVLNLRCSAARTKPTRSVPPKKESRRGVESRRRQTKP